MIELLKRYGKQRFELLKIQSTEKGGSIGAALLSISLLVVFGFFFFIFLNISLALLIGRWLDNYEYGFYILTGFYLLLILLVLVLRKAIKNMVTKKLINLVFNK